MGLTVAFDLGRLDDRLKPLSHFGVLSSERITEGIGQSEHTTESQIAVVRNRYGPPTGLFFISV